MPSLERRSTFMYLAATAHLLKHFLLFASVILRIHLAATCTVEPLQSSAVCPSEFDGESSATVVLSSTSQSSVQWTIYKGDYFGPWVSLNASSGTLAPSASAAISLACDASGLPSGGNFSTVFKVNVSDLSTSTVCTTSFSVALNIATVSHAVLLPWPWPILNASIAFNITDPELNVQSIFVRNFGPVSLDWIVETSDPFLAFDKANGTLEAYDAAAENAFFREIHLYIVHGGRAVGTYTSNVTFTITSDTSVAPVVLPVVTTVLAVYTLPLVAIAPIDPVDPGTAFWLDGTHSDGSRPARNTLDVPLVEYVWYGVLGPFYATGPLVQVTVPQPGLFIFQLHVVDTYGARGALDTTVPVGGTEIPIGDDDGPSLLPTPTPRAVSSPDTGRDTSVVLANAQAAGMIVAIMCTAFILCGAIIKRFRERRYYAAVGGSHTGAGMGGLLLGTVASNPLQYDDEDQFVPDPAHYSSPLNHPPRHPSSSVFRASAPQQPLRPDRDDDVDLQEVRPDEPSHSAALANEPDEMPPPAPVPAYDRHDLFTHASPDERF